MRKAERKATKKAAAAPAAPARSSPWLRFAAPAGGLLLIGGIVWGLLGRSPASSPSAGSAAAPPATVATAFEGRAARAFVRTNWSHLEQGYARAVPVAPERRDILRLQGDGLPEDLTGHFAGTTIVEVKGEGR